MTTSACSRHSFPRTVSRPGSPGPPPTRKTRPGRGSAIAHSNEESIGAPSGQALPEGPTKPDRVVARAFETRPDDPRSIRGRDETVNDKTITVGTRVCRDRNPAAAAE